MKISRSGWTLAPVVLPTSSKKTALTAGSMFRTFNGAIGQGATHGGTTGNVNP
ncbi:hypothetical protein DAI22_06g085250 [Oryza sativa Japonica Group]|nr:hypothetical protein DAI22_06g085250 [Oryza sativa Japonica Group]